MCAHPTTIIQQISRATTKSKDYCIPNSDESQRDDHSDDVPKAIDDEIGSIMENNTWVLSDLPPGCKPLGCKWIFKRKMKVDGTIDKFKARLVIQGFRQKEGIDYFDTYAPVARITTIRFVSTPMDLVEKLKLNTGKPVDQLEYSRAIGCLMYAMASTRPDIAYVVSRLSRFTSNP
ncbi:zinc finger, CCHC-type containing protein [Tanacetum coccineum]